MEPVTPFWFKQRQCRMEPVGTDMVKVTGPNLGEAFLKHGFLRQTQTYQNVNCPIVHWSVPEVPLETLVDAGRSMK